MSRAKTSLHLKFDASVSAPGCSSSGVAGSGDFEAACFSLEARKTAVEGRSFIQADGPRLAQHRVHQEFDPMLSPTSRRSSGSLRPSANSRKEGRKSATEWRWLCGTRLRTDGSGAPDAILVAYLYGAFLGVTLDDLAAPWTSVIASEADLTGRRADFLD
jgi:hypothetical protein